MARLAITLACGDYDRTRALADGRVGIEGVDLTLLSLSPEETFFRMVRFEEFDVAELSLSTFVLTLQQDAPFVAIPVFPSRAFRHNGIYVNAAAGIDAPEQLAGRRVGIAEYQLTANVWIRGILADFHGVPVDAVRYVTGGLHQPGRDEKMAIPALPEGVEVTPCPAGRTLSEMLVSGEIQALYTPRVPRPFLQRDPRSGGSFPLCAKSRRATSGGPGSSPSCMSSLSGARSTSAAAGWPAHWPKPSGRPATSRSAGWTRPPRCHSYCPGSMTRSAASRRCWATTTGRTA